MTSPVGAPQMKSGEDDVGVYVAVATLPPIASRLNVNAEFRTF